MLAGGGNTNTKMGPRGQSSVGRTPVQIPSLFIFSAKKYLLSIYYVLIINYTKSVPCGSYILLWVAGGEGNKQIDGYIIVNMCFNARKR